MLKLGCDLAVLGSGCDLAMLGTGSDLAVLGTGGVKQLRVPGCSHTSSPCLYPYYLYSTNNPGSNVC